MMDAFVRLGQLIDQDSNMSTEEMSKILVEEGYANSEDALHKFFNAVGIE